MSNFNSLLQDFPDARVAERLPTRSFVEFATAAGFVETLEGRVACDAGAAIVTGVNGERWPVTRERFERTYEPDQGTQAGNAGLYLRRPQSVLAHQLKAVARVTLSGGRGDLTAGAGDWLVEYSPGDRALVAQDVFAKTYRLLPD